MLVGDDLARPDIKSLQPLLIGAHPDRSIYVLGQDPVDPAVERAIEAKDGEAPGARVQTIETVLGASPDVALAIEEQGPYVVMAQARRIRRIMPICFEPSGSAIKPVQPSSPGSKPECARAVFCHGVNGAAG